MTQSSLGLTAVAAGVSVRRGDQSADFDKRLPEGQEHDGLSRSAF